MEETCGGCRTATTNGSDYMRRPCATQDYLYCETRFHNAKITKCIKPGHQFVFNQRDRPAQTLDFTVQTRVKPLTPSGHSRTAANMPQRNMQAPIQHIFTLKYPRANV
ncbi:hypothetical protein D0B32_19300 [Paraburkholderia sp. DHOC27]|nr:hypothetical protein D0B32_19300 [Paraburkholderia sp. DHOC27]